MISVSTSIYEREHGKKPRGLGHWAFHTNISNEALTIKKCPFEHSEDHIRKKTIIWVDGVMMFSQAKNKIVSWLKESGMTTTLLSVAD